MAVKACAIASIVSRPAIVWGRKMVQLIPQGHKRLLEGANRILKLNAFTTDATLDAMSFASRAMASSVVAIGGLWLQA